MRMTNVGEVIIEEEIDQNLFEAFLDLHQERISSSSSYHVSKL